MNASQPKTANKNWLKLSILPVLFGVLGYVIWSNQSAAPVASGDAAPAALPAPIASAPALSSKSESPVVPEVKKAKRVAWPKFTTEQILATNPFRGSAAMRTALKPPEEQMAIASTDKIAAETPEESPEEEIDPWAALTDSFKGDSSAVFLESSKGQVLKVGTKMLKVGDRIGDRYRVTEVRPDGIVVEAAPALQ
jgi:hypothetical protein